MNGPIQEVIGSDSGTSASATIATPARGNTLILVVTTASLDFADITIIGGGVAWTLARNAQYFFEDTAIFFSQRVWYGHDSDGSGTSITVDSSITAEIRFNVTEWRGLYNLAPASKGQNAQTGADFNAQTPVLLSPGYALLIAGLSFVEDAYRSGPSDDFTRLAPVGSGDLWLETAYRIANDLASHTVAWEIVSSLLRDLISFWKLDEVSGTRNDSVSTNHLTSNNGVTQIAGKVGNAAHFTAASSQSLSIADNPSVSTGDISYTIACWFRISSDTGGRQMIICKDNNAAGQREFDLTCANTGVLTWSVYDGTVNVGSVSWSGIVNSGDWYFVVCWHDESLDSVGIQVNGGSSETELTTGTVGTSTAALRFGARGDGARHLDGDIDAVGFWKRLLDPAEKTALFNLDNGAEWNFGALSPGVFRYLSTITAFFAPYISLEIDWDNDRDFFGTSENITTRLWPGASSERGKGQIRAISPPEAGRFNALLNNTSRDYSVENESSPLYGLLEPGKLIRLRAGAYDVWSGVLDDLLQHPDLGELAVGIPALGTLSRLREKNISTRSYQDVRTDQVIGYILAALNLPLTERLIGFWKLDEVSGIRFDSVGVNHLTDNNTVTQAAGKIGNAAQFTAANSESLSRISNSELSTGDIDYTIAGWFYLDSKSAIMTLVGKDNTVDQREYVLFYNNTNDRFEFRIRASGSIIGDVVASNLGSPAASTWYFIAAWHDAVSNEVGIQVNALAANVASTTGVPVVSTAQFEIGGRVSGTNTPLNGRADAVGFYKKVLSANELTGLYNLDAGIEFPFANALLSTGDSTLEWWWADNQDAFSLLLEILNTEGAGASIYEDELGRLVFENRDYRNTETRSTVSQHTFVAGEELLPPFDYAPDYKDVFNICEIPVITRAAQARQVIWELGSQLVLGANASQDFIIHTSDPFIDATIPSATPSDTIQILTPSAPLTSGTFKLKFRDQVTVTLNWNDTAATIQTELEGLSTIGANNILCFGDLASAISCVLIGVFAGQNITDKIEIVEASLNPISTDAVIEVDRVQAGNGISSEVQALRPSTALAGGGPYRVFLDLTIAGGSLVASGNIPYNANAAAVQVILRAMSGMGSTVVTGGPLSSGVSFVVNLIYSDALPLMEIQGFPVTGLIGTATIETSISVAGGIPDYIVIAGEISFSLDRSSGASCTLTALAGAAGATVDGLRQRARPVTVIRSELVKNTNDTSASQAKYGKRPINLSVRKEISRANAQTLANGYADYNKRPRPNVNLNLSNALSTEATIFGSQISNRITVVEPQTGVDRDYWIEHVAHAFFTNIIEATFGCEAAHSDTHSDAAHADSAHTDSVHSDAAHSDTHSDDAHTDGGHTDSHSDSGHSDVAHTDIAHTDAHTDGHADTHSDSHSDDVHTDSHSDDAHGDNHSDTAHSDTAHTDSHSDLAHSDDHGDESFSDLIFAAEPGHTDTHSDESHTDFHSDDAHVDTAHSDGHSDSAHTDTHTDTAFADSHTDVHVDAGHSDTHTDTAHTDTAHSDTAHGDSHSDASHSDSAHGDTHSDTAHSDGAHSDVAHGDSGHADSHVDSP